MSRGFFPLAAGGDSRKAAVKRLKEGLLPLDQVPVVPLDEPDVILPFVIEPVPGFDSIAVHIR